MVYLKHESVTNRKQKGVQTMCTSFSGGKKRECFYYIVVTLAVRASVHFTQITIQFTTGLHESKPAESFLLCPIQALWYYVYRTPIPSDQLFVCDWGKMCRGPLSKQRLVDWVIHIWPAPTTTCHSTTRASPLWA